MDTRRIITALLTFFLVVASGSAMVGAAFAENPPSACVATDLSAVAQVVLTNANAAHREVLGGEIVYSNTSSQACTLQWIPAVQVVDGNGAALPVTENYASSVPQSAVATVTLQPGARALTFISWSNLCLQPAPPGPYGLKIKLPNDGTLSAPFSTVPPFAAVPPGPPCTTSTAGSTIDVEPFVPQPPSVPHDARYFPQTGFRIDNDTIWDYFNRRGGITTFGYPVSRTFLFQGFQVQFFQRRIVQIGPNGQARLLNVLDPGLLPYTSFNFATFPAFGASFVATAPNPTDAPSVLAWVKAHAPDSFNGKPVNFYQTFQNTVPFSVAFPNGGNSSLLAGLDLEVWGVPTSQPTVDPNNHNFVYLRFQRGIMMYDAGCNCTQGILLADYLKSIITGQNLPPDLNQEAQNSPFYKQYDPGAPRWVRDTSRLPNTDLTNAFTQE